MVRAGPGPLAVSSGAVQALTDPSAGLHAAGGMK